MQSANLGIQEKRRRGDRGPTVSLGPSELLVGRSSGNAARRTSGIRIASSVPEVPLPAEQPQYPQ